MQIINSAPDECDAVTLPAAADKAGQRARGVPRSDGPGLETTIGLEVNVHDQPVAQRLPVEPWWGMRAANTGFGC